MMTNKLIKQIKEKRESRLNRKAKVFPQRYCRASSIGECDRELVLAITDWDKKPVPHTELQARFEEVHNQESIMIRELMEDGFNVLENQQSFEIKNREGELICTGHIDGKILFNGTAIPFEIKSLNVNIYNQINSVDDFNKYSFFRKYPRQIQLYMYANNTEEALYIISDCMGHRKFIPVYFDYEACEKILQRLEKVHGYLKNKELPDFCEDNSICQKCWALGTCCFPEIDYGEGLSVIEDVEVEEKLKTRGELQETAKEYARIDKELKEYFKNKPNVMCGDFHITGKIQQRKKKVPITFKEEVTEYWTCRFEKIVSENVGNSELRVAV